MLKVNLSMLLFINRYSPELFAKYKVQGFGFGVGFNNKDKKGA